MQRSAQAWTGPAGVFPFIVVLTDSSRRWRWPVVILKLKQFGLAIGLEGFGRERFSLSEFFRVSFEDVPASGSLRCGASSRGHKTSDGGFIKRLGHRWVPVAMAASGSHGAECSGFHTVRPVVDSRTWSVVIRHGVHVVHVVHSDVHRAVTCVHLQGAVVATTRGKQQPSLKVVVIQ